MISRGRTLNVLEVMFTLIVVWFHLVIGSTLKPSDQIRLLITFLLSHLEFHAPQMVGLARGAFDSAMPYLHERRQFGQPIADFQGMQFQYARAAAEIEAARVPNPLPFRYSKIRVA